MFAHCCLWVVLSLISLFGSERIAAQNLEAENLQEAEIARYEWLIASHATSREAARLKLLEMEGAPFEITEQRQRWQQWLAIRAARQKRLPPLKYNEAKVDCPEAHRIALSAYPLDALLLPLRRISIAETFGESCAVAWMQSHGKNELTSHEISSVETQSGLLVIVLGTPEKFKLVVDSFKNSPEIKIERFEASQFLASSDRGNELPIKIAAATAQKIILLSFNNGSGSVRSALAEYPALARDPRIVAWVSVDGQFDPFRYGTNRLRELEAMLSQPALSRSIASIGENRAGLLRDFLENRNELIGSSLPLPRNLNIQTIFTSPAFSEINAGFLPQTNLVILAPHALMTEIQQQVARASAQKMP